MRYGPAPPPARRPFHTRKAVSFGTQQRAARADAISQHPRGANVCLRILAQESLLRCTRLELLICCCPHKAHCGRAILQQPLQAEHSCACLQLWRTQPSAYTLICSLPGIIDHEHLLDQCALNTSISLSHGVIRSEEQRPFLELERRVRFVGGSCVVGL